MRVTIGRAILDTQPCSSASQVISQDSDLYGPLQAPPVLVYHAAFHTSKNHGTKGIFKSFC